ncbi:MAG: thiamine pyrophosphate-dependent enzyme [Caldimonas sp.]
MTYRAADALADALVAHGVDRAFGVPGESFLAALDALLDRPQIDLVTCRHEGAAALAAVADARLCGAPGVLFVSRGPGMANATIGVHVAQQDALPLVVFVGQVDRPLLGRGAFQEVDYRRMYGGVAKLVAEVMQADRMSATIAQAFSIAQSGTPGPVIVVLPEDVLSEACAAVATRPLGGSRPKPSTDDVAAVAALIAQSRRPVVIVGAESRSPAFRADLRRFSERWQLPVAVTNKNQDQFANEHPNWLGHLGFFVSPPLSALLAEADLVLAIGTRLGDVTSQGYTFPRQAPAPQTLVHVYPDGAAMATQFRTERAIVSGAHAFVQAMLDAPPAGAPARHDWLAQSAQARDQARAWSPQATPPADVFGHVVQAIATRLAPDAIVTLDAGNFSTWPHRLLSLRPAQTMLAAACGAMGMGVPAALAAALRHPGRQVIAFCGDGGYLMTGNELATIVGRGLAPKIVVANNRSYGTIRSYQERQYPRRVNGTDLNNPDFAMLAAAYGAGGFRVSAAGEAEAVVAEMLAHPGPALLEVVCDIEQIMAGTTLSAIRP